MATDDRFLDGAFRIVSRMVSASAGPPDLSRYAVQERLGEGATAVVYRAEDRTLRRAVALKVLRESLAASEEARARFVREARAAAGLSHPNVVAVHDAGEQEGRPYLVMELVDGRPLTEILRDRSLPLPSLLALLEKAARGVEAAHEKGIVHRDLKPGNILVTASGEPKVADFGLAHASEAGAALTRTGAAIGTPLYMAPEQVRGEADRLGPWTDVYALGAILYEAITGQPPHAGRSIVEIYGRIAHEEPVPPRRLAQGVPADAETICLKALEKDPARRYPDAKAFAEDLRRHLAGEPILARPPGAGERAIRWLRRRGAAAAVGGLVAACALLLWMQWNRPGEGPAVARELVSRNLHQLRQGIEQWRRERRDPAPLEEIAREAERLVREEKFAKAATLVDQGLMRMSLEDRLRVLRQDAREGQTVAEVERLMREGKLPEAMAALQRVVGELQQGIERKMQRVQEGIRRWQEGGRDPSPVARLMPEFEGHMKQEKLVDAEAVLDRALEMLRD